MRPFSGFTQSLKTRKSCCVLAAGFSLSILFSHAASAEEKLPFLMFNPPSYVTSIMTGSTNFVGEDVSDMSFLVFVGEINDIDSNGVHPVKFTLPSGDYFGVEYDSTLTSLNGRSVSNADWEYSSVGGLHTFTYIGNGGIFPGNTYSFVGINATFVRPQREEVTLQVDLDPSAGGQVSSPRPSDSDVLYY
ncbi:hypothetical protein K6Q96_06495 [Grimontia kaedaensis]|uniref:Uncharacterized protein n=1 Tax=Grimontia kaedaensis TaxID=2872157 RepID=A0ABY4WXD4_9GAMM|nr:hypothetical protein [Grimontia kaedaensis]USH03639.1 hypothetical protein K6Q96_06495 [Grimontia kaedaensis]